MTIREQLQLLNPRYTPAALAEMARQQRLSVWRTWGESLACIACGAFIGLLIVFIAG